MTPPRLLRRRTTTPLAVTSDSGAGQSMPSDVMEQTCRRVTAVAAVAAGLWSVALVVNTVVARFVGHPPIIEELWPYPGLLISLIGLGLSVGLTVLGWKLSDRPQLLLDLSACFLVLNSLLASILTQWSPPPISPRISWVCILILIFPGIVPSSPARTLAISLTAASMEPLALLVTHLRGVPFDHSPFYFIWSFLPTYICALISVVPAKVIRGLGQQVRRARELGSYRLEEVLGRGGMGEVYRASHQLLARPAAIKLIRAEVLGASSPEHARVIVERFRREAQASASLRSPHSINLYDFGVAQDGTFFLVMEMLEGLDLQLLVDTFGPLPAERVVYLMRQACESLAEAHARGLIHRDIKPSNIFTCRMGLTVDFVKVLDFGLVKAANEESPQDLTLTAPDATAGTPAFIAPEVVQGERPIDHRVDLYALGCVAYWLLTGRLVFEGSGQMQMMLQHLNATPLPPSERVDLEIPAALDQLVLACLAKNPDDRPADAAELARRLDAIPGERWSHERALHWWALHHPETVAPAPTRCTSRTIIKSMASEQFA